MRNGEFHLDVKLRRSRYRLFTLLVCCLSVLRVLVSYYAMLYQYNESVHRKEQHASRMNTDDTVNMFTLFTFTFAKRWFQCNIAHRTQIRKFRTHTALCPFLTVWVIFFGIHKLLGTIVNHPIISTFILFRAFAII